MDGNAVFALDDRDAANMVDMLMGDENCRNPLETAADSGKSLSDGAGTDSGIDENFGFAVGDVNTVSFRA